MELNLIPDMTDLLGKYWEQPDMVGKTVAVFIAPEVKTVSGKISPEQEAFINTVNRFGGIAAIVRNEDEAEELFK